MDNKTLLQKADLALSDLATNGGLLLPEQSDAFVRKLISAPTIMNDVRVVTMGAPERKINKIGFGSRILRSAPASGTALDSAKRAKPTTSQVTINTKEIIAEVNIPYDVMEDNIERTTAANNEASNTGPGGLRQTIIELMAERAALDLELYALTADTGFTDSDAETQEFYSMQNGWLKLANQFGNVYDHGGAEINKALFKNAIKTMPDQYLRNPASVNFYVNRKQEVDYRDRVADRATALGDSNLNSKMAQTPFGHALKPVNTMPNTKGIFTDPMNLIIGFWRNISFEYDKNIHTRQYEIVLTMRAGLQIEETEATVALNNLKAA